jgi:DNA-binding MarR family transcriptional regulator
MVETKVTQLPEELVSSPSFLLKRLGMAAKERALEAYEAADFHPYLHAVLAVLEEGSRETQGEIADALDYDRGQLVGILDELEGRGLVERQRDPDDRRRHVVSLTAKGRTQLVRLRKLIDELEDDWFTPLSAAERKTFHELLLRLAAFHDPRYVDRPCS